MFRFSKVENSKDETGSELLNSRKDHLFCSIANDLYS